MHTHTCAYGTQQNGGGGGLCTQDGSTRNTCWCIVFATFHLIARSPPPPYSVCFHPSDDLLRPMSPHVAPCRDTLLSSHFITPAVTGNQCLSLYTCYSYRWNQSPNTLSFYYIYYKSTNQVCSLLLFMFYYHFKNTIVSDMISLSSYCFDKKILLCRYIS